MADRNGNTDAEDALLGALLLVEDALTYCIPKVEVEDFTKEINQKVYRTLQVMYEEGSRIDPVLVRRKAKVSASVIAELMDSCPVPKNYPFYVKQVTQDAEQRLLARTLYDAAAMAHAGESSEAWSAIEDVRERLSRQDADSEYDAARLLSVTLDVADAYAQGSKAVLGTTTGWPSIDKVVGGLVPGNLWVVAARPGKGKSAWAANLLVNVARSGEHALLLSLEMSAQEIGMRLLCRESKLNWESLRDGKVPDAGRLLVDAATRLSALPLTVNDNPRVQVGSIRSLCQALKPAVVIVDYVQLMSGPVRSNREQEVAAISRGLKLLAKEERCTVIALAQLNRQVEMRGDGASPQLSDLRDSGALEQDADIVAFITPRGHNPYEADLEFNVAKNRNGMAKAVFLTWNKPHIDMYDKHLSVAGVPAPVPVAGIPGP